MHHDHDAVARHVGVELQRVDADFEGARERGQRVFGREAPGSAMALEIERRGACAEQQGSEEQGAGHEARELKFN